MMTKEASLRLSLLRFPLIVGVVFIHAYETAVGMSGGAVGIAHGTWMTDFVRNLVSQGLARVAVPLFFLISGYLLFMGFTWSFDNYAGKLKSRVKTLLIPFVFWNLATLLLIATAQALPATAGYFSGKNALVASFGPFDYVRAIFGIGRMPISYQFWFIRDLMMLVVLTPVVYAATRLAAIPYLVFVLACWAADVWLPYAPSVEATLFFSIGCYLALSQRSPFALDRYGKVLAAGYAVAAVLDAALFGSTYSLYLHKIAVLLGCATALYATQAVTTKEKLSAALMTLSGASFFVYAAHEPLLTIARKVAYKVVHPNSPVVVLALYLLIPSLIVLFLVFAHRGLSAVMPRFARTINGGR